MLLKLWINKSIYFPSKINNKFSKFHPIYFFFISLVDWWIEYNILCRDDNLNTILLQQFGVLVKFVINMQWPKKWIIFLEVLWKWLKIGEIEVSGNCQFGARIDTGFFSLARVKVGAWMEEFGARIVASTYFRNLFFGPDLSQFYGRYFYYKYRLFIRVNLEIERAETRV